MITITFTFSMHARATAIVVHSHTGISVIVALLVHVRRASRWFGADWRRSIDMRRRLSDVRKGIEHAAALAPIRPKCSRWSTTSMPCSTTATGRCSRALAKAGDLAHGLKTPLAVLAREAEVAAREASTISPPR